MAQDKKKNESALSFLESNISWETSKKGWLNFSEWFTYKNQDLDSVHNSADDIKEINRTKVGNYIWNKISTGTLSDSDIKNRTDSMNMQQIKWFNEKAKTNEYDLNTLYAYIDHWDERKDPYAAWTWMFEKKWTVINADWTTDSNNWMNKWLRAWLDLLWWEGVWLALEKRWQHIYNRATPQAKDDVSKIISNKNKEPLMDSIDERIAYYSKKIKDLKSKWWNEEEISKLERAYNQLVKQKKSRTTEQKQTIRDFVREEWYAWSNMDIATDINLDKDTMWITDIEEKMAMSDAEFSKADILKSLTREDFWVSESVWEKEYKPIIDAEIEFYTDKWNVNMLELHDWKNELDNEFEYSDLWERIQSAKNNIKSRTQDKISEKIKTQLDKEYPWQWMSEKVTKYWELKNAWEEFKKRWWAEITKKPSSKNRLKPTTIENETRWLQRKVGKRIERLWKLRPTKIWSYIKWNKKLMALIWLWAVVLKNPVAQASLTALEIAWDVDMAKEWWDFIEDYRKFAPIVQRIHARFDDKDTRLWWEFAWMTEEEKEKKYPLEEVKKDIQWLSDNWYEDFVTTYLQYEMPDLLWWGTLELADFDDLWDYVWWRLKNEEEDLDPVEKMKRKLNWNK